MVWSWISFKISSSLRSTIFDVLIWGWSTSPMLLLWLVNTRHQASKIGSALFHASHVFDARQQRTSYQAAQTPSTGWSSRIFYHHWKPTFQRLMCDGPKPCYILAQALPKRGCSVPCLQWKTDPWCNLPSCKREKYWNYFGSLTSLQHITHYTHTTTHTHTHTHTHTQRHTHIHMHTQNWQKETQQHTRMLPLTCMQPNTHIKNTHTYTRT